MVRKEGTRTAATLVCCIVALAMPLAGCLGPGGSDEPIGPTDGPGAAVDPDAAYDTSGPYSRPLEPGVHTVGPLESFDLAVSDGERLGVRLWRPETSELVPVIVLATPYGTLYQALETSIASSYTTIFLRDNFVPHGFAVAEVSLRGTQGSTGCMEWASAREQLDVAEAVQWLGDQPWANGRVGMVGASYDGYSQWMAAGHGPDALKTIVPISGVTDLGRLLVRNGTPEDRAVQEHVFYASLTAASGRPDAALALATCDETPSGAVEQAAVGLSGDVSTGVVEPGYWSERNVQPAVLDSYEGSVLLVHGLRDWNVESSQVFPFIHELQARRGVQVGMMLGQWGHASPDSGSNGVTRWDWAETLLQWFNGTLRGDGPPPALVVAQVQDDAGSWRTEATWPPAAIAWQRLDVDGNALVDAGAARAPGSVTLVQPGQATDQVHRDPVGIGPAPVATSHTATTGPLAGPLHLAGMPRLHATMVPSTELGGRVYAELLDIGPDSNRIVGHAFMDLRFHEGGIEPVPITPGEAIVARMQMFPLDAVIPAGHELVVRVVPDVSTANMAPADAAGNVLFGMNAIGQPAGGPIDLVWGDGATVLHLPVRPVG